jgi:hypothetical protein
VSKLINQIYRKLRVNNRTEAINRWLEMQQPAPPDPKQPARLPFL